MAALNGNANQSVQIQQVYHCSLYLGGPCIRPMEPCQLVAREADRIPRRWNRAPSGTAGAATHHQSERNDHHNQDSDDD